MATQKVLHPGSRHPCWSNTCLFMEMFRIPCLSMSTFPSPNPCDPSFEDIVVEKRNDKIGTKTEENSRKQPD